MSAAGRQLARIESALRRPQPSKAGDRRAIVAAILRRPALRQLELEPQLETTAAAAGAVALDTCDLFFVLRSVDPKGGRWSGQVAFPGGHAEGAESDEEAVRTLTSTFTFHPRLLAAVGAVPRAAAAPSAPKTDFLELRYRRWARHRWLASAARRWVCT